MNLSAALCLLFGLTLLQLGLSRHELILLGFGALFLLFIPACIYMALDPGDQVETD